MQIYLPCYLGQYQYVHDGHCAGGWISNSNSKQNSLADCFSECKGNSQCGYFAFDEGATNCALYTVEGGCPDDDNYPTYNAYKIEKGVC